MLHLISQYQNTMDGHLVFMAIKNQAEGKHAVIAKSHTAYKAIANAKFTSKHKSTNFATFSKIFHTVFNHLQEVGQEMSKVQKIKVFCDNIDCGALAIAKGDTTFDANLYPTYKSAQGLTQQQEKDTVHQRMLVFW
jgi:hypothetical protein